MTTVSAADPFVGRTLDEKYIDATSRLKAFAFNPGRSFSLVYRVLF